LESNRDAIVRTAFKRRKRAAYNERKRRILAALQGRGWITAAMVAALSDCHPKKGIYACLNRLRRWGLVRRRRHGRGLLVYALSERGRSRLDWLSSLRRVRGDQEDLGVAAVGRIARGLERRKLD